MISLFQGCTVEMALNQSYYKQQNIQFVMYYTEEIMREITPFTCPISASGWTIAEG
jgi:hypothetical protein